MFDITGGQVLVIASLTAVLLGALPRSWRMLCREFTTLSMLLQVVMK